MATFAQHKLGRGAAMLSQMRSTVVIASSISLAACFGPGEIAMPKVEVTIAGTAVPAGLGSYCWPSGGNSVTCADMLSIETVIQGDHLAPSLASAASPGTISFDRRPKSMGLMVGSDEAHLQAVPLTGNAFQAPVSPGRWVYMVSARWAEGDVSWVFVVSVV
jgi:hypothetical protein